MTGPNHSIESIARLIPGYDPFATAGNCRFDPVAAERPIRFFETVLHHVKGELAKVDESGERRHIVLEPWQKAILANLFGWKRPDGSRRYRKCFLFVPRKNGKTTLAAGVSAYVFFCDNEPGAECYCVATDADQARLVFDPVQEIILGVPALASRCRVYKSPRSIQRLDSMTVFRPISSAVAGKHGYNSHFVVVDELHAHGNRELVDVMETSTGARRQPLMLYTTTSDYQRDGSICNEMHEYATRVRDGVFEDETFLPVIYEADVEDDWTSPAIWRKANPNLGVSFYEEELALECRKAQEMPSRENTFKRLRLNIRTEQDIRWLPVDAWNQCGTLWCPSEDSRYSLDAAEAACAGQVCFAGLDLGSTRDLSAFVLVFPMVDENKPDEREDQQDNRVYRVIPYFWAPREGAIERERKDKVPYLAWANAGLLTLTEGKTTDNAFIRQGILAKATQFQVRGIAVDRLFQSNDIIKDLSDDGFEVAPCGQGFFSMAAPTKELEALVVSGRLQHGNHPILNWMARNVTIDMDPAGNLKPNKKKSGDKIDGIVALIMGIRWGMSIPSSELLTASGEVFFI